MEGRRRLPQTPRLSGFVHISEPELDMRREGGAQPGAFARLLELVRRLISDGGTIVSPMRSIGRELEESWPTGEG
jgi:hypothetical protein